MTLVLVTYRAKEEDHSSGTLVLHRADHIPRVYPALRQVNGAPRASLHRYPPAMGGRSATSSPSRSSVPPSTSSKLTATLIDPFILTRPGCSFKARESSSSIVPGRGR